MGSDSTKPPTSATLRGTVKSSVGLVMIASETRLWCAASMVVSGYSSTRTSRWLNPADTAVATAHAHSETITTRRSSLRCSTVVMRRSSSPANVAVAACDLAHGSRPPILPGDLTGRGRSSPCRRRAAAALRVRASRRRLALRGGHRGTAGLSAGWSLPSTTTLTPAPARRPARAPTAPAGRQPPRPQTCR